MTTEKYEELLIVAAGVDGYSVFNRPDLGMRQSMMFSGSLRDCLDFIDSAIIKRRPVSDRAGAPTTNSLTGGTSGTIMSRMDCDDGA